MQIFAIITAAGQGLRFGGAKQFSLLAGKPVLFHSIKPFEDSSLIDGICLTVPERELEKIPSFVRESSFKKIVRVVPGGKDRQESVKNGFISLPPCDLILVHDGVRPLITQEVIEDAIREAEKHGTCVVGTPVRETTKKVDGENHVVETIARASLWNVQTPQVFRYEIFKKALEQAARENFTGTDESMLVERMEPFSGLVKKSVKLMQGRSDNIKITTPEDLTIAEALLKIRLEKK